MILQLLSPGYINQCKKFYELFRYFNTCSVIALFVVWTAEKNREKVETKRWFAKMYLLIHIILKFLYIFSNPATEMSWLFTHDRISQKKETRKMFYMTFCTLKTIKIKVLTDKKNASWPENICDIKQWFSNKFNMQP